MQRILLVLTIIVILSFRIVAQVRVSLTDSTISPGEQTELVFSIEVPVGSPSVRFSRLADSFRSVEVIERKGIDSMRSGDRLILSERYVVTSFDSGVHLIPSRRYELAGRRMLTDSVRLYVVPVVLKGEDYRDIREIMEVEEPGRPYVYWIFIGGIVLVSVGLVSWFFRGRPHKQPKQGIPVHAFTRAMQALEELETQDRSDVKAMKRYYGALYDVFREYVQAFTGFSMLHLTTGDLILRMKGSMDEASFYAMAEVFRIADAVKFARYASSEAEAIDCLERTRQVIRELNQKHQSG